MSDPSIPAGTPMAVFQSERFDKPAGTNLLWDFPVTPGQYLVRLYFAETASSLFAVGARVFDVAIVGAGPAGLAAAAEAAEAGHEVIIFERAAHIGGQVQLMFLGLPPSGEHIRAGRVRALAVTTSTRWGTLPDTATLSDFVPGYEASQWLAAGLRKGTPAEIVDKLNKETTAALADAKMKTRLADLGTAAFPGTRAIVAATAFALGVSVEPLAARDLVQKVP